MKKLIYISFIICLLSSCKTKERIYKHELEGQEWIFINDNQCFYVMQSWNFLSNNRFEAIEFYSGGASWKHHFSGSFYYNTLSKTVFLEYDRNELLKEDHQKSRKKMLKLKISKNDTIPIIKDVWKRTNKDTIFNNNFLAIQSLKFGESTFKIIQH